MVFEANKRAIWQVSAGPVERSYVDQFFELWRRADRSRRSWGVAF